MSSERVELPHLYNSIIYIFSPLPRIIVETVLEESLNGNQSEGAILETAELLTSLLHERARVGELYAVNYLRAHPRTNFSLDQVTTMFANRIEKPDATLDQICEGTGLSIDNASRMLRDQGFRKQRKASRVRLSHEQERQIERAYDIEMSFADIAYFLDIRRDLVRKKFERMGGRPSVKPITRIDGEILTYRLAHQIFLAKDMLEEDGVPYNMGDVRKLAGTTTQLARYALKNRDEIEATIEEARIKMIGKNGIEEETSVIIQPEEDELVQQETAIRPEATTVTSSRALPAWETTYQIRGDRVHVSARLVENTGRGYTGMVSYFHRGQVKHLEVSLPGRGKKKFERKILSELYATQAIGRASHRI